MLTVLDLIDLHTLAASLPQAWCSQVFTTSGKLRGKVLRMDGQALPEESHPYDELLLVLSGQMPLRLHGAVQWVRSGQCCRVPAGTPHAVDAGSDGVLLIFEPDHIAP